jgi:ribosomal-protein-alanine N-acetyltransferase
MVGPPALCTGRLVLRPLSLEDAADIFAYASDPEIATFVEWTPHVNIEESQRYLNRVLVKYKVGHCEWGIVDRNDGRVIGTCGFIAHAPLHSRAEIVYVIARDRWKRGFATEAAAETMRFGFTELKLNRIEARCLSEHVASRRVLSKLGMVFEGTLREHVLLKGRFVDLAMFSVLRNEWRADGPDQRHAGQ